MSTTQNMGLTVPDVSVTTGPQWAQQINSDLSIIDSHNHAPNSGVQIPTAGININDDLSFNQSYSPLDVQSVGFTSLTGTISSLINRVYVSSGNLYFNNGSGTPVQITTGSSVAGASGTITGPGFTASFATDTFSWRVTSGSLNANMDCGPVLIRPSATGAFGIQLESPTTLSSNQTLRLPARPTSQSLITMSNGGVQTTAIVNSTLTLTTSSLSVAPGGITSTELSTSPAAVATANIQNGAVTRAKLAPVLNNQSFPTGVPGALITTTTFAQVPSSNVSLPVDFTLSGVSASRPIVVMLQPQIDVPTDPNTTFSYLITSTGSMQLYVRVQCSSPSVDALVAFVSMPSNSQWAVSSVSSIFIPPGAGTYIFTLYAKVSSGTGTIRNCRLVGYQL